MFTYFIFLSSSTTINDSYRWFVRCCQIILNSLKVCTSFGTRETGIAAVLRIYNVKWDCLYICFLLHNDFENFNYFFIIICYEFETVGIFFPNGFSWYTCCIRRFGSFFKLLVLGECSNNQRSSRRFGRKNK